MRERTQLLGTLAALVGIASVGLFTMTRHRPLPLPTDLDGRKFTSRSHGRSTHTYSIRDGREARRARRKSERGRRHAAQRRARVSS